MVNPREDTAIQSCFSLSLFQRPPSFPTRNSDLIFQSGFSSMLFVFCAAFGKRSTNQIVENFQNTISHWKKRLYCDRTAAEAKRRCLWDYCWTSIIVIPHLDEFLSRLLLLQIKEWKRRVREACCGMHQSFSFPSSTFPNAMGSCKQTGLRLCKLELFIEGKLEGCM